MTQELTFLKLYHMMAVKFKDSANIVGGKFNAGAMIINAHATIAMMLSAETSDITIGTFASCQNFEKYK